MVGAIETISMANFSENKEKSAIEIVFLHFIAKKVLLNLRTLVQEK